MIENLLAKMIQEGLIHQDFIVHKDLYKAFKQLFPEFVLKTDFCSQVKARLL